MTDQAADEACKAEIHAAYQTAWREGVDDAIDCLCEPGIFDKEDCIARLERLLAPPGDPPITDRKARIGGFTPRPVPGCNHRPKHSAWEACVLAGRTAKLVPAPDPLAGYTPFSKRPRSIALERIAEVARNYFEVNDDGHRCGGGDSCASCDLRGALDALPKQALPSVSPASESQEKT